MTASKYLAEVVGVCKPTLHGNLLQWQRGFEEQLCRLVYAYFGGKASWAHARARLEEMAEMGPAHAILRRERGDVERVGQPCDDTQTDLFYQSLPFT